MEALAAPSCLCGIGGACDCNRPMVPTAGIVESGIAKHPAYAAASLAVTVMGLVYGLVPAGQPRRRALGIGVAVCAVLAAFSILTRAYTPSEIGIGFMIGFSIPFLGFRLFAPEAVFPVTYRSGRTAHLDIGGDRGAAIDIADGRRLFGKLYAQSHLRADRWYKLGRTVMYGALEDERSFNSVRRMVEYEDYMLRYLRDNGVPTAEPHGFAEI